MENNLEYILYLSDLINGYHHKDIEELHPHHFKTFNRQSMNRCVFSYIDLGEVIYLIKAKPITKLKLGYCRKDKFKEELKSVYKILDNHKL